MNVLKTTAIAALLAASGAATAVELTGNVALTTDYVWRGISQSDNAPAIQGGFDADLGQGLYAGVWGSNVEFNNDNSIELDLYAGWAGEYEGVGVDVGVIHYHYSGSAELNANEAYVGVSFGPATLTQYFGLDTGSESTGDRGYGNYTDLALDLGSYDVVGFSTHLGYYDLDEASDDYWDVKLAASTTAFGVDFELAYTDTDHTSDNGKQDDDKVTLTVSKSL